MRDIQVPTTLDWLTSPPDKTKEFVDDFMALARKRRKDLDPVDYVRGRSR